MKSFWNKGTSSRIDSMEYDSDTEVLQISFKRGGVYRYENVPWNVWDQLISSTSVGKGFNTLIKGQFSFTKLS